MELTIKPKGNKTSENIVGYILLKVEIDRLHKLLAKENILRKEVEKKCFELEQKINIGGDEYLKKL